MNAYRLTRHAARGMHACARLTTLLYTTCNREHGASRWAWGGATNLRPLPEGAEEGRAARVQCRPGWAGPRLVRYGPVRQKTHDFRFLHPARVHATEQDPLPFNVDGSGGDRDR